MVGRTTLVNDLDWEYRSKTIFQILCSNNMLNCSISGNSGGEAGNRVEEGLRRSLGEMATERTLIRGKFIKPFVRGV